jgi:hypothetical protein
LPEWQNIAEHGPPTAQHCQNGQEIYPHCEQLPNNCLTLPEWQTIAEHCPNTAQHCHNGQEICPHCQQLLNNCLTLPDWPTIAEHGPKQPNIARMAKKFAHIAYDCLTIA